MTGSHLKKQIQLSKHKYQEKRSNKEGGEGCDNRTVSVDVSSTIFSGKTKGSADTLVCAHGEGPQLFCSRLRFSF